MDKKLNNHEIRFINFIEEVSRRRVYYYLCGFILCIFTIIFIVLGILLKNNSGFLVALLFGGMAYCTFFVTGVYIKFHDIISKIKSDNQ